MFVLNPLGGFSDPARAGLWLALRSFDSGSRPPKSWERKFAEIFFDFFANGIRRRVNIENFSAIGGIHRARGDGIIGGGIHVVPPKKFCAGELRIKRAQFIPDFFPVNDVIGLFPELNFRELAIVPTVADDSVMGWCF